MTSSESNSIRLEIRTPLQIYFSNHIFYSIPQNDIWLNNPIKFHIIIFNKTSNSLHLHPLQPIIPELVTFDGEIIQRRLVNDDNTTSNNTNIFPQHPQRENLAALEILPKYSSRFNFQAKLTWENDILKLKIPTVSNYLLNAPIPQLFWCFDELSAKKYHLRFILNTNIESTSLIESNTNQEVTREKNSSVMIASTWLNICLVQPLSTNNRAIEANGATFKIDIYESVFTIPNKQTEAKTDVKLGIQITNNTSNSLHFFERGCIDVALMDDDGKEISTIPSIPSVSIPGAFTGEIIDYSVKAGKSTYINLDSIISWRDKNLLQLAIPKKTSEKFIGAYSYFCFGGLVPNKQYYLYVTYHFPENASHLEDELSEKIWSGWVTLPPVIFTLVEP